MDLGGGGGGLISTLISKLYVGLYLPSGMSFVFTILKEYVIQKQTCPDTLFV